jgi:hypothetical protein
MRETQGAPAAVSASIGPGCASSSASPKSLPTKPIERNAMASVPASAPGPKMPTNSSAHTSEFTLRDDTSTSFAARFTGVDGTRLWAASTPTGSAITSARRVPSDAMWMVSISASCTVDG